MKVNSGSPPITYIFNMFLQCPVLLGTTVFQNVKSDCWVIKRNMSTGCSDLSACRWLDTVWEAHCSARMSDLSAGWWLDTVWEAQCSARMSDLSAGRWLDTVMVGHSGRGSGQRLNVTFCSAAISIKIQVRNKMKLLASTRKIDWIWQQKAFS